MKPIGTGRITPSNVVGVIMGGGAGTRLFPLTRDRSKPAVPIAGKYRLVDIPISNCINSDIRNIYVLTQFNSASLHRHIHQSYRFDRFSRGFVEILAAQQTLGGATWYQGTADAVRQNLRYLTQEEYEYVLILSGDHIYRMDYRLLLQQHLDSYADITVAALPVHREQAPSLGILQVSDEKRIVRFVEKPSDGKLLEELKLPGAVLSHPGVAGSEDHYLANMGIYVFNREVLRKALDNDKTDFGKHIIPDAIDRFRTFAYAYQGYWQDVGTIGSFYEASLDLCSMNPNFSFFERSAPVYTHARFLPPSRIIDSHIRSSLIADGCVILKSVVDRSSIGVRSYVNDDCVIRDSILMGCDFYETERQESDEEGMGIPHMSIGRGCRIERASID